MCFCIQCEVFIDAAYIYTLLHVQDYFIVNRSLETKSETKFSFIYLSVLSFQSFNNVKVVRVLRAENVRELLEWI